MLIDEMHYEFQLEFNKIDSNDLPDLLPVEIDSYLQRGIWIWLKKNFDPKAPIQEGFEASSLQISKLANLHIKSPEKQAGITPTSLGNNTYEIKLKKDTNLLDYDYLVLTRGRADITSSSNTNCTKSKVKLLLRQTDDTDDTNTYTKPSFKWSRVTGYFGRDTSQDSLPSNPSNLNHSIFLETAGDFTINTVYLDYIKYPNRVFYDGYDQLNGPTKSASGTANRVHCDIDAAYHPEIISLAVLEAQRDLKDLQGFQTTRLKTETES